jgi:hypothetical protein
MHTSIHSEPPEITRHSRTQWFTAYIVLSPVIGFLATVACGVASADLTPAPWRQDHTSIFWYSVKHDETKKTL